MVPGTDTGLSRRLSIRRQVGGGWGEMRPGKWLGQVIKVSVWPAMALFRKIMEICIMSIQADMVWGVFFVSV